MQPIQELNLESQTHEPATAPHAPTFITCRIKKHRSADIRFNPEDFKFSTKTRAQIASAYSRVTPFALVVPSENTDN
jgi:hypothetical protein